MPTSSTEELLPLFLQGVWHQLMPLGYRLNCCPVPCWEWTPRLQIQNEGCKKVPLPPAASHHLGCHLELYGAGTSPAVQWWRIHLLMQGTQFWSQVQEDSSCCRATNPLNHWRRKQTEQAPSWKQDSILGWTIEFELYAQYLWKRHTNWKTRSPEGRAPWLLPRL